MASFYLRRLAVGAAAATGTLAFAVSRGFEQPAQAEAPPSKGGHHVVVVGGGTAGVTVAAQILKRAQGDVRVSVVEPSSLHQYQPLWTMVGGGLGFTLKDSQRPMSDIIPRGATWLKDSVSGFSPDSNSVKLASGEVVQYDRLVVAMGIKNDMEKIPGLQEALDDPAIPVGTIYDSRYCEKVERVMKDVEGGDVFFTQPNCAFKCGGAPQKVMWLSESRWRKSGMRDKINIHFSTSLPGMFHVPKYRDVLQEMATEKKIDTMYRHNLIKVDGPKREATFEQLDTGAKFTRHFDAMHVTPYMSPPEALKQSALVNETGYVPVDKHTLQHTKYPNVFALGDASAAPTSKTAAAISSQAPVVVSNVLHSLKKEPLTAKYDGYTSCPILVGDHRLILAEFGYDLKVMETLPWDQGKPSYFAFWLKRDFFPAVYWSAFVKGTWYGKYTFFRPATSN